MNFTPHTPQEIKAMLKVIGAASLDEFFQDIVPGLRPKSFAIPEGKSESQVLQHFKNLSQKNENSLVNFIGAGFYEHYIPAVVDALSSRAEFYTAYTPYQPECSQGWLQAIYEYQTAICELTGLEVANASLYDGGTAIYEAAMMAARITGKHRIIIDSAVNPIYRKMLHTHTANLKLELVETPFKPGQTSEESIAKSLDKNTAAVILQNPNFFGAVSDYSSIAKKTHQCGALVIISVYPISLGILKSPGEMDADIAVGEGQSLGLPLSFGGPYLGFMAAKKEFVRQMPGRIVGATVDQEGKRGFVLTLQTREQHIRRQKATSNICSNQALCALRALIYLSSLGKSGLKELAELNFQKAEFAKNSLAKIPKVKVDKSVSTFNEFTLRLPKNAQEVLDKMVNKGFVCGLPLARFYPEMDDYLLVAVTEEKSQEEIVNFSQALEKALCS